MIYVLSFFLAPIYKNKQNQLQSIPIAGLAPDFIFPNDTDADARPVQPLQPPVRCANNQTFCEQVHNYPLAAIEAIIERQAHRYSGLFDIEPPPFDLNSRFDGNIDEQPMCSVVSKYIWPKSGMLQDGSWAFIVNSDKYKQSVLVEECETKAAGQSECNFAKNFPNKTHTECRQMFTYHRLLSTKDGAQEPVQMHFKFPSCCQCFVSTQ